MFFEQRKDNELMEHTHTHTANVSSGAESKKAIETRPSKNPNPSGSLAGPRTFSNSSVPGSDVVPSHNFSNSVNASSARIAAFSKKKDAQQMSSTTDKSIQFSN